MQNSITSAVLSLSILSLSLLGLTACTSEPARLQQGSDAETTKDGLVKVDHSKLDLSYARPNVEWKKYTKLYFAPVKVTNDHPVVVK
ncbi:hypothetical protein TUM4438_39430 [Shewanella sairae]|uniref:Uncharacterized protein n=1 Tax=Shewanella sairae TaxID=190310 RepID=A0ABQ4PQ27_9GAMM|nr:DUF3313 domain-containing protein [Shewanella sairae]MCL1132212.1 DUF3313 domain-containing protein [Shewanella sairae]GIU51084.1 hypothetical protein TUM4438_39430 [Shewanella sairae]